jgi:bifunctional non-homologous end joining protein LigD
MEGREPSCASVFTDERRHEAKGKRSRIDYLVCNNEATLLWMVNLGCIDINPWNSRIMSPGCPDFIAIDLDPSATDGNEADRSMLLDTAIAAKEYCDKKQLKAFAKTSGKTGMHFFIPCSGFSNGEVRSFAEKICADIHELVPRLSTTENSISSRGNKLYIDPSQNDYADTLASVYSVRPAHLPLVSTPLDWKEINRKLNPYSFTMHNIQARIEKNGDLFAGLSENKWRSANNKILMRF